MEVLTSRNLEIINAIIVKIIIINVNIAIIIIVIITVTKIITVTMEMGIRIAEIATVNPILSLKVL